MFGAPFQGTFPTGIAEDSAMPYHFHAWFRKSKNAWYVMVNGKQTALGVKGAENEAEAERAWHRLFAGMPLESTQKPLQSQEPPQPAPMVKVNGVSVSEV